MGIAEVSVLVVAVIALLLAIGALGRARRRPEAPRRLEEATRAERLEPLRSFKAEILGRKGERLVAARLERLGLPALQNIVLVDERGATQIDHVLRTASGIVVLETKRFSGVVTRGLADREWQHTVGGGPKVIFARGRRWRRPRRIETEAVVTRFQNPLRQNYRHVAAVRYVIGDPDVPVNGYVVSVGPAEFRGDLANAVKSLDAIAEILIERRGLPGSRVALDRAWARLGSAAKSGEGWRPQRAPRRGGAREAR
jgi:Nuclease-related domain